MDAVAGRPLPFGLTYCEHPLEVPVKLSRIFGFWRRNRSALKRKINNLWNVQGAE